MARSVSLHRHSGPWPPDQVGGDTAFFGELGLSRFARDCDHLRISKLKQAFLAQFRAKA